MLLTCNINHMRGGNELGTRCRLSGINTSAISPGWRTRIFCLRAGQTRRVAALRVAGNAAAVTAGQPQQLVLQNSQPASSDWGWPKAHQGFFSRPFHSITSPDEPSGASSVQ